MCKTMQSWWSSSLPTCLPPLLLLLMSNGGRNNGRSSFVQGRPQGIDVATAPPSVTDAPDDSATAATLLVGSATTAVEPRFLYPLDDGLLVNSVDEIEVRYETSWADLTLSVTCKGEGVGGTKSFDVALKEESGKYILSPVDSEITISKYPVDCSLILQDQESVANFVVGPEFRVESTRGDASLYALETTRALAGSAAATASGSSASTTDGAAADAASNSGTNRDGSSSGTPTANDSRTAAETGVAGNAAPSSSSDDSSSGGLSAGTSAGIAIGVILAVALIAFIIFYLLRTRRRMAAMQDELQESRKQNATERAYVDGILKVAGKPDTRNGGRVVMAEAPNRGSGEWKLFFNTKGPGGRSAPPSRLANTVLMAPSQSPSPGPYSPGMDSRMGADGGSVAGSTVGLVSNSAK